MPFVVTRTNTTITPAQEAEPKASFGAAIEHVPGKSEQRLLLVFEDQCHMWLAGENDEPVAYIEANIFASEKRAGYEGLAIEMALALRDVLGIHPSRTYIRYADIPVWSVANRLFDRRMYQ